VSRTQYQDKSPGIAKLCFAVLLFSSTITIFAAEIDWKKLEKQAKEYTEKNSARGNKKVNVGGKSVNISIPSQPTGRNLDTSARVLNESDKRHILVHMKLANRHFTKKNYPRAIDEVNQVFERQPDHPGGRFMLAVIAARLKDHATAWHNIFMAREKDPENPKIKSFIEKLNTVAPEPQKTVGVTGIFRPMPISASEKACDIIERLLKDPSSYNITSLETDEYKEEAGSVWLQLKIGCSSNVQKDKIVATLEKASGGRCEVLSSPPPQGPEKILDVKCEITGMTIENKEVKAISDLSEFIKIISEESDVAISDTVERDVEGKILETTYDLATRDFKSLNDFLRKVSPYAHKLRVINMKLGYIGGTQDIIWRCRVRVFYQLS
jgi:hypothetical protein